MDLEKTYLEMKRKEIAYHEAGHAVIGYIKGYSFSSVWIVYDDEIIEYQKTMDEETTIGKVQYNSPVFDWLIKTKVAEIDDESEFKRWHDVMVDYCLQTFSGCVAEYYIGHDVGKSLPNDIWQERKYFTNHYLEMDKLLIKASESAFYPDYFSDSFLDEQIKHSEKLVSEHWNTISLLAEELIREKGLDWEEVDELIKETESTTSVTC